MPLPLLLAVPAGIMTVLTVIQVIGTVISLILTLITVIAGFDSVLSFATDVKGPAATIMTQFYDTITGFLPFSFNDLWTTLDNTFSTSSSNSAFTPPLTFSGLANRLAFGEVFNTVVMVFIDGLIFVLNVRFLRWSLNNLRIKWKT